MVSVEPSRQGAVLRAKAHTAYRRSLEAGAPLSAVALAEMLGRSERWARAQISAVQAAGAAAASSGATDVVTDASAEETATALPLPSLPTPQPEPPGPAAAGEDTKAGRASLPESADSNVARQGRGSGYWWALNSFLGGVALSVAANVAHTFHPSAMLAGTDDRTAVAPGPGAVVAAACWPLLLLGAVEVVTRVPWPRGLWWSLARYGGAVMVALIAAYMSYRHMSGLLRVYGEDPLGAGLGPLAVDGLMVVSGFALLAIGLRRKAAAG